MPAATRRRTITRAAVKVPEITAAFWVIKVLTTGGGEAASDYLASVSLLLAATIGFAGFAAALALQLRMRRHVPWVYWSAVSAVAVFGTMAADALHVAGHVPYVASSVLFATALVAVFWSWSRHEPTLSIHSITTVRRELFYWAAVLATFAMGTALGDLAAYSLGLGFLIAGILFAILFVLPGVGFYAVRINGILAFWAAYVMTRPLGASFADWTGKTRNGALGWGDGPVAAVLVVLIAVGVAYLTVSGDAANPVVEPVLADEPA